MSVKLKDGQLDYIKQHAITSYPFECCGLVVNGAYYKCVNIAKDGKTAFEICPSDYALIAEKGAVQAVVHSHVNDNRSPSKADIAAQMAGDVPWFIVVSDGQECRDWFWFGEAPPVNFKDIDFRFGVNDCFSFTRHLLNYRFSNNFPDLPREQNEDFSSLFTEYAKANGFKRVVGDDSPKVNDVFMMRIGSKTPNHIGVFVGSEKIAHHLNGMKSSFENIQKWQDRIDGWWRYEPDKA